jgi:hypothetical protein
VMVAAVDVSLGYGNSGSFLGSRCSKLPPMLSEVTVSWLCGGNVWWWRWRTGRISVSVLNVGELKWL